MTDLQKIIGIIDGYRDNVIYLQTELTKKIALGPKNEGSGEHDKTEFAKKILEELNPDFIDIIRAPDENAKDGYRPNLIAIWGDHSKSPCVWILSHSDIVPPGNFSLWNTDPYQVKVEGDKIIGRGVEDNQHGFISSLLALKAILESGQKTARPIGLAFVADEETGSKYGLDFLMKNYSGLFKKDDIIIVPDGGNFDGTKILVAEKSMLWMKFTLIGQQCHASTPDKGKNTLYGAARLIVALDRLKEDFCLTDDMFSPPYSSFEATKSEANVPNVNTIPGKHVFYMDCRILPCYTVNEVLERTLHIVSGVSSDLGLEIKVETHYRQDNEITTSDQSPVVRELAAAIKLITGKEAKPMGMSGGTVAAFFRHKNIPAVVWCTMPNTPHQPNEYSLISNTLTDAKIFACLYLAITAASA